MIYIIGHTNPDLDSAVSSVALKYLFDKVKCYQSPNSQPLLASKPNYETKFIFDKFKFQLPLILNKRKVKKSDEFILVDHNEASQRGQGIADNQITNIFDHHKVSLNLSKPIYITIKPWGSTCTLIWWLMKSNQLRPSSKIAPLMISAILSDTVGLKSKTTTDTDKKAVKDLNKIAKINNIDQLTLDIFKAKSNLGDLTNKQIITKDYKIYNFKGKKVLINQIETVDQERLIKKSEELIQEMKKLKKTMKIENMFCLLTDILKINSKCFVCYEDESLLLKSFPKIKKIKNGVYDLGAIMSRKKEVAPLIEKAIV